MGFAGGGGTIAIATDLPPSCLALYCKHSNGLWLDLIFYACLMLGLWNVETNPGPRRSVPAVSRKLCSNVRGLSGNLSDLTVASSKYDILLCSETLVSDMRPVSELLVPGFGRPVLLCPRHGRRRKKKIWSI